ncbi:MAG TPA: hypothetical protein VEY09_17700 [Pyrinomonadaceae bacterium]|nr:hypothetical protein [Pyrinomonadaceae bacterium]
MSNPRLLSLLFALALCLGAGAPPAAAQSPAQAPLTSEEFLVLVRQLPKRPALKGEIIEELRRRGIGFTLTSGLRSVVATRSGNDPELRRALEEAERRFLNPAAAALPSAGEAAALLDKAREATLAATEKMPDFVVKQLISRSYAHGRTRNWRQQDRLVVGVSYRASEGEKYRLLAQNGLPTAGVVADERSDYAETGGTSSTGEFVTALKALFDEKSRTEFKAVDTDTLRGRRTIVYEYEVKLPNSQQFITYGRERSVKVGYRGKVWLDRELGRVLRIESKATDIPADFPVTATERAVDYDWVNIEGQGRFLLPARAILEMTALHGSQLGQTRNDIQFRGYQKYGAELRIIEEDIVDEDLPVEPEKP